MAGIMARHDVVEMDREDFLEVIELDPSSSLVSLVSKANHKNVAVWSVRSTLVSGR